ncbi:MAG: hypothetical protein LAT64_04610 [Phycisphaerales bacterium]|nr:hypothetical protein [Planctomycetota bacterium]MCH8508035.1 hypothetical protein [Phycisphaerales bacterium]
MPRRCWLLLIACLAMFVGAAGALGGNAAGPAYLNDFPPADRVMRNMERGVSDETRAAARQAAAFEHLVRLIERIGGDRAGPDRAVSERERALVGEYTQAAERLRGEFCGSERFAELVSAYRASESFEQEAFEANFDGPWIAQWVDTTRAREVMAALRAQEAAREPGFEATTLGRALRAPDPRTAAARLVAIVLLGLAAGLAFRLWRPVALDPNDPLRPSRGRGRFGVVTGLARACEDDADDAGPLARFTVGDGAGPFEARGAVVHAGDPVSCVRWPGANGADGVVFVINHAEGARFARMGPIRRLNAPSPWPVGLSVAAVALGWGVLMAVVAAVILGAVWFMLRQRFSLRFALHEGERLHEHLDRAGTGVA